MSSGVSLYANAQGVQRSSLARGWLRNSWTRASTCSSTASEGGDSAGPDSRAVVGRRLDSASDWLGVIVARASELAANGSGLPVIDCGVRVQATSNSASGTTIDVVLRLEKDSCPGARIGMN